jgi:serine O-acetyltransferase
MEAVMQALPGGQAAAAACAMDGLWQGIRAEALARCREEPALAPFLQASVLDQAGWRDALARYLGLQLARHEGEAAVLQVLLGQGLAQLDRAAAAVAADLRAATERDPACRGCLDAFLFWKGFHALQTHRIAHGWWLRGWRSTAQLLQYRASTAFGVDIHPAARFGQGILLDHATGFVAGETSIVEDDVSLLHGVTLGGRRSVSGDRHPKVRRGASIGVGAILLGNLEIGEGAKVGAGSTLLHSVPAGRTAVGDPARLVDTPIPPNHEEPEPCKN